MPAGKDETRVEEEMSITLTIESDTVHSSGELGAGHGRISMYGVLDAAGKRDLGMILPWARSFSRHMPMLLSLNPTISVLSPFINRKKSTREGVGMRVEGERAGVECGGDVANNCRNSGKENRLNPILVEFR
jgi:hypothetical protein